MASAFGVGKDCRAFDVDTILCGTLQDCFCQTRLEVLGAISEVGFRRTHVGCVGHRILPAFGETEHAVGKILAFVVRDYVAHFGSCFK